MALPSDLIDLLAEFAVAGVEYLLVGGQALVGRQELIRLKLASGRPQDLLDAERLGAADEQVQ